MRATVAIGWRRLASRPTGAVIAGLTLGILTVLAVLAGPVRAQPAPVPAAGWVAPLPEPLTVTRTFDPPETRYGAGHRGVDLAAPPGSTIVAAGPGTVVFAGPLAGRGVVSVEHAGGLRTTYEPVAALVAAGQAVSGGQPIGELTAGHPGCPSTACLHWGLRRGEVYLDPLALLSLGPVRLFPRYGGGAAFRPAIPAFGTGPESGGPGDGPAALSAPLPVLATLVGLAGYAGMGWRRRRALPGRQLFPAVIARTPLCRTGRGHARG